MSDLVNRKIPGLRVWAVGAPQARWVDQPAATGGQRTAGSMAPSARVALRPAAAQWRSRRQSTPDGRPANRYLNARTGASELWLRFIRSGIFMNKQSVAHWGARLCRLPHLSCLLAVLLCFGLTTTPASAQAPLTDIAQVSAGGFHTCALTTSGGVKCWGSNSSGQLGDGTTTDRVTPVDVSGLSSGVSAIAGGGSHTCALTTGGGVKCWGSNSFGQLGDGTGTDRLTPVNVVMFTDQTFSNGFENLP
jgi:hypothetical protein